MSNFTLILILALIGGIIGWITNILAIKLMFRPINPIKIPIINIKLLGLIPKRKDDIAKNIGQVIANELLSIDDLINKSFTDEDKEELINFVKNKINTVVSEKLNFIPAPFRMMVAPQINQIIDEEIDSILLDMEETMVKKLKEKINIEKIVADKINDLDLLELEKIIINVAKKELKHIEVLGLILGFIIGLIQGIIVTLI